MSNDEKFLGRVYSYDPIQNNIIIHIDFIDPDQQAIIEQLNEDQSMFSFWFKKPYRPGKMYYQLKYYFSMLKKILIKFNIFPSAKNIKTFDEDIKRTSLKCEMLQIDDKQIPVIPSKADLSFEAMDNLNKIVESRYAKFLDSNIVGE